MPVLLSEADVRAVLSMNDLIDAMETALDRFSSGGATQPLRSVIDVGAHGSHHAFYGVMPALVRDPPALGTKLVSVFSANAGRGLPTHLATIVLLDPETGALAAIVDGRYITEARTAAVSAASARHLARDTADVLAVLGTGVQARSHIDALTRVRPILEIRIWGRTAAHVDTLIEEMQPKVTAKMRAARSPAEAADGAAIVALATASTEAVLTSDMVADGTHICAVGACRPTQREMDTTLVRRARVFVDSRTGALAEAGDIVIPIKEGAFDATHIAGELGDVFGRRVEGRRTASDVTLFKSLGMAVEDVAAARLAWERACGCGLGRGFVL
jgi:ornithine cyclodeaminase